MINNSIIQLSINYVLNLDHNIVHQYSMVRGWLYICRIVYRCRHWVGIQRSCSPFSLYSLVVTSHYPFLSVPQSPLHQLTNPYTCRVVLLHSCSPAHKSATVCTSYFEQSNAIDNGFCFSLIHLEFLNAKIIIGNRCTY